MVADATRHSYYHYRRQAISPASRLLTSRILSHVLTIILYYALLVPFLYFTIGLAWLKNTPIYITFLNFYITFARKLRFMNSHQSSGNVGAKASKA